MLKNFQIKSWILLLAVLLGGGNAWAADSWVKTAPADLQTGDIVVIIDQISSRAMSNNNGTSAPSAVSITLNTAKDEITGIVESTLQWDVTASGEGDSRTYQFSTGDNYLYVTNTNNGVKVASGSSNRNTFTIVSGGSNSGYYLYNKSGDDERYVGCYNSSDWRCYTSINNNIKGNNNAFYKKVTASGPVDPSVTISSETIATGSTATISGPEGLAMTFSSSAESVATVDEYGVVTGVAAGTAIITATWSAVTDTYNAGSEQFTVTVIEATTYEKVTDAYQLVAGNEYIIVAPGYNRAMGAQNSSVRGYIDVTISNDNKVAITDEEVAVLTLGGTTDEWTFLASDNSLYLALTSSSNALHTSDDPTANGSTWTVTEDFMLQNNEYNRVLKYNSGSPRFACYASGQQDAVLFVKSGSALDTKADPEFAFSKTAIELGIFDGDNFIAPTLATATGFDGIITYAYTSSNDANVVVLDENTGEIAIEANAVGTITVTATSSATDLFKAGTASYTITIVDNRTDAGLAWSDDKVDIDLNATNYTLPTLTNSNNVTISYSSDNEAIALIDASTGETIVETSAVGTATITATFAGNASYKPATVSYVINIIDPNQPGTENNPYNVSQAIAATPTTGEVYISGIVSSFHNTSIVDDGSNYRYYISDDGTTATQLLVYKGKGLNQEIFTSADDLKVGDEVVIYGKLTMYQNAPEIASGNYLVSWNRPADTTPSITVDPATVNATSAETSGTLSVTYKNVYPNVGIDAEWYTDATCTTTTTAPSWIEIRFDTSNNVIYSIAENTGEARTAYMKIWSYSAPETIEYSELITFTQAAPVVPTYATLPFSFDGGKADIDDTDGLYQDGLDSDYASSPKLKFNGTGDYVLLQFSERPGTLTFDVKGNTFSGGTFTVQTSEDGVTYTDLKNYTDLGATQSEEFDNLGENVRYIKWIYTEKVNGNVALGNITLVKYVVPSIEPSITVNPATVDVNADEHEGTLAITYENLDSGFDIMFYDSEGTELNDEQAPGWIMVDVAEDNGDYVVSYMISENDDDARTAYFKVYAMDNETNLIYSNLVTITQAAPVVANTYTLATSFISGKHYVIASGTEGDVKVMGSQKDNNRAAVDGNVNGTTLSVTSNAGVTEFVIYGPDANMCYTIYDASKGYLYAAGSGSGNNYLRSQTTIDDNSRWSISIDGSGEATVVAQGSNTNKNMRFNNTLFSCYGSTSSVTDLVYFYEKDGEATPTETIHVTDAKYATYCSENALDFEDTGLTAYVADQKGNSVTFEPVTKVPAYTGLLVKADAAGDYTISATSSFANPKGSDLKGVIVETKITGAGIYVLMNGSEGVGFYKTTKPEFTLSAHTAYLPNTMGLSRSFIGLDFDDDVTTAIESMATATTPNGEVYNLQGQRIGKSQLKSGLYIVGGKKMLVK